MATGAGAIRRRPRLRDPVVHLTAILWSYEESTSIQAIRVDLIQSHAFRKSTDARGSGDEEHACS